jgi:hypothetical protein
MTPKDSSAASLSRLPEQHISFIHPQGSPIVYHKWGMTRAWDSTLTMRVPFHSKLYF